MSSLVVVPCTNYLQDPGCSRPGESSSIFSALKGGSTRMSATGHFGRSRGGMATQICLSVCQFISLSVLAACQLRSSQDAFLAAGPEYLLEGGGDGGDNPPCGSRIGQAELWGPTYCCMSMYICIFWDWMPDASRRAGVGASVHRCISSISSGSHLLRHHAYQTSRGAIYGRLTGCKQLT